MLVSPLLVASIAMGQSTAPGAQDDAPKPAKPSFRASGIQGTTAPSGYSGGATEEHGREAAALAAKLLEDNLDGLVPPDPAPCDRQAALLHAALTDPASFDANDRLGVFYLQHRSPGLARRYLELASALREQDRQAPLLLAIADVQAHSYAEALETADRLLRADGRNAAAHRVRATVEALNGQNAEALKEYGLAARFDPSDDDRYAEALATLLLGSAAEAERLFLAATATHPGSSLLWFGLGMTQAVLGKTAESIRALLQASELDPDNVLAAGLLAQQSGGSASSDAAVLSRIEALVKRHPELAVAHYDQAIVLYRMGRASNNVASIRAAAAALNQAISEDAAFAAAHFQLALVDDDLLERGDTGARRQLVVSQLQRAVDLNPDIPEWHYRLSRAYAADHQPALSAAELQRFQELKRKSGEGTQAVAVLNDGLPIEARQPSAPCEIDSPRR